MANLDFNDKPPNTKKQTTIGTIISFLDNNRPREVYFLSVMLFMLLFMDTSELFDGDFDRVFDMNDSIVYGLIRGIGDDNLRYFAAETLYWICAVSFVFLTFNKGKRISKWLWNE